jgi:hypothetical protein
MQNSWALLAAHHEDLQEETERAAIRNEALSRSARAHALRDSLESSSIHLVVHSPLDVLL